jgi:hypothetical protein
MIGKSRVSSVSSYPRNENILSLGFDNGEIWIMDYNEKNGNWNKRFGSNSKWHQSNVIFILKKNNQKDSLSFILDGMSTR